MENDRLFIRDKLNPLSSWWFAIDSKIFLLVLLLMAIGLIAIITASPTAARYLENHTLFFLFKQAFFVLLGISALIVISTFDLPYIKLLSCLGLVVSILLLILVLIIGDEAKGARRWLSIAGFSLQPSEFAKTFFVVVNAWLLSHKDRLPWSNKIHANLSLYATSILILGILCLLLAKQPDYGMILLLIMLYLGQIFMVGLPLRFMALGGGMVLGILTVAYLTVPHVHNRLYSFWQTLHDTKLASYQVRKSLESLQNGLWFGTGPGEGVVKYSLPDCHTDFIFPVLAEELGISFCIFLLGLYLYIIMRVLRKLFAEDDFFVCLAVFGLILQFSLQVVINIGVTINFLPTKGLTLPFISYGGSSMLNMSLCFGLILSLTKKHYGNNRYL